MGSNRGPDGLSQQGRQFARRNRNDKAYCAVNAVLSNFLRANLGQPSTYISPELGIFKHNFKSNFHSLLYTYLGYLWAIRCDTNLRTRGSTIAIESYV